MNDEQAHAGVLRDLAAMEHREQEESAVASNDGLSLPPVKKNCFNCKHIEEWSDTDTDGCNTTGGYHCEKQYQKAEERGTDIQYENNMCREEYLKKGKVCFELKQR